MQESLGLLDSIGLSPSIYAADAMLKAAPVRLAEIEYSGGLEITTKILGAPDAVERALEVGKAAAGKRFENFDLIPLPAEGLDLCIEAEIRYIGILSSYSKLRFVGDRIETGNRISFGIIETIGYLPLVAASDEMLKRANVTVLRSEKIGGMMASTFLHGLPGDVRRAIAVGRKIAKRFEDCLIGAFAIENPHPQIRAVVYGQCEEKAG